MERRGEAEARLQAVMRMKTARKLACLLLGPVITGPFHERGFPAVVDSDITFNHFGTVFRHTVHGVEIAGEAYCLPFSEGKLYCAVMTNAATQWAAMRAERAACLFAQLPLPWAPGAWAYRLDCSLVERERPMGETAEALRVGKKYVRPFEVAGDALWNTQPAPYSDKGAR